MKKFLAVFPFFIFFAFPGLFVFASPSSLVVFESQSQILNNKQKQDLIWKQIRSELRNRHTYLDFSEDFKPLFAAAKDDTQYAKEGSEFEQKTKIFLLDLFAATNGNKKRLLEVLLGSQSSFLSVQKSRWNSLVDAGVGEHHIDALLNPQYAYLAKTPISIKKEGQEPYKTSLEPLFLAAKKFRVISREEFSKVKIPGFREIIWDFRFLSSVEESDINAALITADAENKPKLNNLWSEIKDELKKPEYAYLSKTPILIDDENYDLKLLFEAAHSGFADNGYALPLAAKIQLQDLVNAGIDGENFKVALTAKNQKLDNFWTQLKKILNQPEFSKWKNTSIKIKNKIYDLSLLFAAKEKADVKGSALPLDAKLQLQKLLNDQVTSKMVENQLLALNQAEATKNKQAEAERKRLEEEAEKNKQAKEKQQLQVLTIGLATGGVLFAAGLGVFLYWFFKIRK